MPHGRKQMRDALATTLAGLVTPQNVWIERKHRLSADLLPAVIVSLTNETVDESAQAMGKPVTFEVIQTIAVEFHAAGVSADTVADTIDQMDLEVEAALAADPSLGNLLETITPVSSVADMSVDQDRVLGVRIKEYSAYWRHPFGSPDNPEG